MISSIDSTDCFYLQGPTIKNRPLLAVIFDMDGLVLDTEYTYFFAWQSAASKMGFEINEDLCRSFSGLHYQHVEQRLLDHFGTGFDLKRFRQLSGSHWYRFVKKQGIAVKKGFNRLLDVIELHNIPYCLATNSGRSNALECLEFANIQSVFSIILARDDVKNGKPDPEIFLLAAEVLNVSIDQCLVVEDSLTGIQAAAQSGATSVFIPSVKPVETAAVDLADYYLNNLAELAQIIHLK